MPSMTGGTADCVRCEQDEMARGERPAWARTFMVCGTCGNKRCPRATWHENACTGSNDPGQPGSAYGPPEDRRAEIEHAMKRAAAIVAGTGMSADQAAAAIRRAAPFMPEVPVPSRWSAFTRWLRKITLS